VDESVEALARTHVPFLIRTDPHDGRRFVDYLEYCSCQQCAPDHPYDSHKCHIEIALATHQANSRILEKYEWLAAYHDGKLRELAKLENRRGGEGIYVHQGSLAGQPLTTEAIGMVR
jgi:hypothetical protein